MNISRMVRVNELLRREIGEAIYRTISRDDIDLGAVTLTHVITSRDLRHARVLVSIREHHGERDRMLSVLKANRSRIQRLINRDLTLKYTPRLAFELDESIEKGDDILDLLYRMDTEAQADAGEPDHSAHGADE